MHPDLVTQLLACALHDRLYKGQGPLVVSKQLLENMMPVQIMVDDTTDPLVLSISIKSGEVLIGTVDNDVVEVIV